MAVDTKPFTDLGYTAGDHPLIEGLKLITGYGVMLSVTEENYDEQLAEAQDRKDQVEILRTAKNYFRDNYVEWPTMTAGQKDAANRNAQRALSAIINVTMRNT